MLPKDLISITRGQLLSFIDTTRHSYNGPSRTAAQKKRKAEFEEREELAVQEARKVWRTVSDWVNDPSLEAVLVLEVKDLWSSAMGQRTFVKLGPTCTWRLVDMTPQIFIGDMPSRRYYASYYCPTLAFIDEYFTRRNKLPYGPFNVERVVGGCYFQAFPVIEGVRDQNRNPFPSSEQLISLHLETLIQMLDDAVLTSDDLLALSQVRRSEDQLTRGGL
mgnify:CR=1 FL=1